MTTTLRQASSSEFIIHSLVVVTVLLRLLLLRVGGEVESYLHEIIYGKKFYPSTHFKLE
jgi:hypothetical protein